MDCLFAQAMILQHTNFLQFVEHQFSWFLRNPLFLTQIVVIWLIVTRYLFSNYGAERLFWEERFWVQFGSMLFTGMMVGTSLFVWYLLDRPFWFLKQCQNWPSWLSLFPNLKDDPETVELWQCGSFMLVGMTIFLLTVVLEKLRQWLVIANPKERRLYLDSRWFLLPGIVGFIGAGGMAIGLQQLNSDRQISNWVLELPIIEDQLSKTQLTQREDATQNELKTASDLLCSDILRDYVPTPSYDQNFHAIALYLVFVSGFLMLFLLLAGPLFTYFRPRQAIAAPPTLLCLGLILMDLFVGWFSFHFQKQIFAILVGVIVLSLWNAPWFWPKLMKRWAKYRFPGLEDYYDSPKKLSEYSGEATTLLNDRQVLEKMVEHLRAKTGQEKPKIVLLAVSGGGIRAAVWVPVVLEAIEAEYSQFRNHLRIITGASGGMVGAALWTGANPTDLESAPVPQHDRRLGLGLLSGIAAEQALLPTVQTMVLRDLVVNLGLLPGSWTKFERGRTLEEQWQLAADVRFPDPKQNPFRKTFADCAVEENFGQSPSLIFSPVCIEDSRRLLISNLDLHQIALSQGNRMASPSKYSLSSYELFKLVPGSQNQITLATAARMNATFPMISPLVSLPTTPPRRIIDAGLYDNYGIDIIANWLSQHHKYLQEETGGVCIVEIRAFPLEAQGLQGHHQDHYDSTEMSMTSVLSEPIAMMMGPLGALLRGRGNICYHRNNALLAELHQHFNSANNPDFLQTVIFELDEEASLNWYLSRPEKMAIVEEMFNLEKQNDGSRQRMSITNGPRNGPPTFMRDRVEALVNWLRPNPVTTSSGQSSDG